MCTYLTRDTEVAGSGLGADGWFSVGRAVVYFDHPQDAPVDHALCVDLVERGATARSAPKRMALELDATSARRLAETILAVLDSPEALELA